MSNHDKAPAWRSGICRANGIDIHYLRTGGTKPPLVALHGLIGSGACLSPLAHALEDHFDVILPDARGHGESSAPEQGYLYRDLAADIIGLLAELGLEAPILAGHSMGGMTAALLASELGSAIKALVLIDPTFISPEWQKEVYESDIAAEHRQLLQTSRGELITQARLRNPNRSVELIEYLVDARLRTSPNAFEVLTLPNPDWRAITRNIAVPALLLTGDRGVVSPETAHELANLNSLLHHKLIADAGHGLPYDMPDQSGAAMLDFLLNPAAMLAAEQLEDLGYHVIEAEDGPSALRLLAGADAISLLITDVGLPGGMNGRQLAEAVRETLPDLEILFITGYAENAVLNHGHLAPGMHVMTKPFQMDSFARRVKALIGGN